MAHLHGYKVDGQVSVGKKHAFALIPPETNLRIFHFSAENDTDRQRYVQILGLTFLLVETLIVLFDSILKKRIFMVVAM